MQLWNIYSQDFPDFIQLIAASKPMQRLKKVGMNCGCEYTAFPTFRNLQPYSRFEHSVGAGLIVWNFTQDVQQSIAALLHDIATPVFAHVVDFLYHDHVKQESTEEKTLELIRKSTEIVSILKAFHLSPEDVGDYHLFPIADNDTPKLSSDRLEYTLGNIFHYGFSTREDVKRLYDNLCVGTNEEGKPEIMFTDLNSAVTFAQLSLDCSKIYVSDEDRYAMQMLAELLRDAISAHILTESDLMRTEPEVIDRFTANSTIAARWKQFQAYHKTYLSTGGPNARIIQAKRRHINPYIENSGRVTQLCPEFKHQLQLFLSGSFDYYVTGE